MMEKATTIVVLCVLIVITFPGRDVICSNPVIKLKRYLQSAFSPTKYLPAKYQIIVRTLKYNIKCESRMIGSRKIVMITPLSEPQCAQDCIEKIQMLITNLNQLVIDMLIKMNKQIELNQPESEIMIKFKPKTNNSKCVKHKNGKKIICRCPAKLVMYGSASAKIIIDRIVKIMSDDKLSSEFDLPESSITNANSGKIQQQLHKPDDGLETESKAGIKTEDELKLHILQRRAEDGGDVVRQQNKYKKRAIEAFKVLAIAAIVVVIITAFGVPPIWVLIPVLLLALYIIR